MRFLPTLLIAFLHLPAWAQDARSELCEGLRAPPPLVGAANDVALCDRFAGKAVLVVNTASQCGYTPQFERLEALYREFGPRGLTVLGFPSDDFGGQEHADAKKTADVCYINYGVTFPMHRQIDVIGSGAHPLFRRLTERSGPPAWNFHKYLITAHGVQGFGSAVTPDAPALRDAITAALNAGD